MHRRTAIARNMLPVVFIILVLEPSGTVRCLGVVRYLY